MSDSDSDLEMDQHSVEEGGSASIVNSANVSATHSNLQISQQSVQENEPLENFSDDESPIKGYLPIREGTIGADGTIREEESVLERSLDDPIKKAESGHIDFSELSQVDKNPTPSSSILPTQDEIEGKLADSADKVEENKEVPITNLETKPQVEAVIDKPKPEVEAVIDKPKPASPKYESAKQEAKVKEKEEVKQKKSEIPVSSLQEEADKPEDSPQEKTVNKDSGPSVDTIIPPPAAPKPRKFRLDPNNPPNYMKSSVASFNHSVYAKVESPPREKPKSNINVEERFYKYKEKIKEKVSKLAAQQEQRQMEECTFKPKVNTEGRRTVEEFLYEVSRFAKNKQEKLQQARDDADAHLEETKGSFQPQLSERTHHITKRLDRSLPVYEKLYQSQKSKTLQKVKEAISPNEEAYNFQPKVNRKSHNMRRMKAVEEVLYEDAVRRNQERGDYRPESKKLMNQKSQQFLCERFCEDFEKIWGQFELQQRTALNYLQFRELLRQLSFLKDDSTQERTLVTQMWKSVTAQNNEYAEKQDLFLFLKALLNFSVGDGGQGTQLSKDKFGTFIDGVLTINPIQASNIYRTFSIFHENRNTTKIKSKTKAVSEDLTFIPQIDQYSQKLAKIQNKSIQRNLLDYINEKQAFYEKQVKLKQEREEQELSKLTFHPQTTQLPIQSNRERLNYSSNNISRNYIQMVNSPKSDRALALYELSEITKQRKEAMAKDAHDIEMEKHLDECSFTPDLTNSQYSKELLTLTSAPDIKGVDQLMVRLKRGRDNQERVKQMTTRGYIPAKKRSKRRKGNSIISETSLSLPHRYISRMQSREEPGANQILPNELVITVNIGPDTTDDLVIRSTDNLEEVVRAFVEKHNMEAEEEERLMTELTAALEEMEDQYSQMVSQQTSDQMFETMGEDPENLKCVDCGVANPGFVSLEHGVFICDTCGRAHQILGDRSTVKPKADIWRLEQLRLVAAGGNSSFLNFFSGYRLPQGCSTVSKYQTQAGKYYRALLHSAANGVTCPLSPPSQEDAGKPDVIQQPPQQPNTGFLASLYSKAHELKQKASEQLTHISQDPRVQYIGGLTTSTAHMIGDGAKRVYDSAAMQSVISGTRAAATYIGHEAAEVYNSINQSERVKGMKVRLSELLDQAEHEIEDDADKIWEMLAGTKPPTIVEVQEENQEVYQQLKSRQYTFGADPEQVEEVEKCEQQVNLRKNGKQLVEVKEQTSQGQFRGYRIVSAIA